MHRLATLAAAGALLLSACGGSGESDAHKQARDDAEVQAGYYCTMAPDIVSIHSSEFKACVKAQAAVLLAEWEQDHPGE